jgi:hypothetical protein
VRFRRLLRCSLAPPPEPAAPHGRREALLALHSCLACFMWLDCTQETVLHHSLEVQTSAPERYLNTAAGWLMLRSQQPSAGCAGGVQQNPHLVPRCSRICTGHGPDASLPVLRDRPEARPRAFHLSPALSGQHGRIWRRRSVATARPETAQCTCLMQGDCKLGALSCL